MVSRAQKPGRIKPGQGPAAARAKGKAITGGAKGKAALGSANSRTASGTKLKKATKPPATETPPPKRPVMCDWTEDFDEIWNSACDLLIARKYDNCLDACYDILQKPHPRFLRVKCFLAMAVCELTCDMRWADHWMRTAKRAHAHLPKVYDHTQRVFINEYERLSFEVDMVAEEVERVRLVNAGKIEDEYADEDMQTETPEVVADGNAGGTKEVKNDEDALGHKEAAVGAKDSEIEAGGKMKPEGNVAKGSLRITGLGNKSALALRPKETKERWHYG